MSLYAPVIEPLKYFMGVGKSPVSTSGHSWYIAYSTHFSTSTFPP